MSEKEVKKCPKCGGTMMLGLLSMKERVRMEIDLGRRWVRFLAGACMHNDCYSELIH